jgi:hypothetical protein
MSALTGDPFSSLDVARLNLPKHLKIEPVSRDELTHFPPELLSAILRVYTVEDGEGLLAVCFDVLMGGVRGYGLTIGEKTFEAATSWKLVSMIRAAFQKTGGES